jgi:hypothetical protein
VPAARPEGAHAPGGCLMASIAALLSPAEREALAALKHEREIDQLVRERGLQRPPPDPPTLTEISATTNRKEAL